PLLSSRLQGIVLDQGRRLGADRGSRVHGPHDPGGIPGIHGVHRDDRPGDGGGAKTGIAVRAPRLLLSGYARDGAPLSDAPGGWMRGTRKRGAASVAIAAALALGAPGVGHAAKERKALPGKVYTWSFQADTLGQKPAHSMAFGGTWEVVQDSSALAASPPA